MVVRFIVIVIVIVIIVVFNFVSLNLFFIRHKTYSKHHRRTNVNRTWNNNDHSISYYFFFKY